MSTSKKVLEIFRVLKDQFGQTIPAGDLLAVAQELAQQYQSIQIDDNKIEESRVGYRYPYTATDEAWQDGGWEILEFEKFEQIDPDFWTRERARNVAQKIKNIMEDM